MSVAGNLDHMAQIQELLKKWEIYIYIFDGPFVKMQVAR